MLETVSLTRNEADTLYKVIIVALEKGGWLYKDVVNMVHVYDKLVIEKDKS
jgi:hypothetical protein